MIHLRKVNRNTQAYTLYIGGHTFYISYNSIVGYRGPLGDCRLENTWGPTTGRHMRELGVKTYPVVSAEELNQRQRDALLDVGLQLWAAKLDLKNPTPLLEEVTR